LSYVLRCSFPEDFVFVGYRVKLFFLATEKKLNVQSHAGIGGQDYRAGFSEPYPGIN